jgi:hypothetical protein
MSASNHDEAAALIAARIRIPDHPALERFAPAGNRAGLCCLAWALGKLLAARGLPCRSCIGLGEFNDAVYLVQLDPAADRGAALRALAAELADLRLGALASCFWFDKAEEVWRRHPGDGSALEFGRWLAGVDVPAQWRALGELQAALCQAKLAGAAVADAPGDVAPPTFGGPS